MSNKTLPASFLSLHPFLDDQSILRVGGRLRDSSFKLDKKHPILLSSKHSLTKPILKDIYLKSFHCGPQQLRHLVREKYWPIHGKHLAKRVVHDCVTCFNFNRSYVNPLLAYLRSYRVQPSFLFLFTEIEYAGPFLLKDRRRKRSKTRKGLKGV